ncbi:hypothetical protein CKM354_001171600 [Cercospora kikuchii]|uniref:WSC domain-containing protein n=1 Tax=Cercospora kikuchii TaxID=84275 RepID=A0A9P3CXH3_9PEZI|nr:uncharacterized protein CKM354_001171600 [Cercospora kikuchii]GIZ48665.1 hypothetical protein CKM354_001171600 [Cercospora kikuchii]
MASFLLIWLATLQLLFPSLVHALGKTDTITWGGGNSRTGYETNHNMDPAIVGSADFGRIWTASLPGNFNGLGREQIFASPLVYTIGSTQYVFIATTQNNIYKLNAKTGEIVARRNLHVPFLTAELDGCVDINPTIGITGTGVIDPGTGLWYFTAKTYADQFQDGNFSPTNRPGRRNGRYYFHAINTADLSEATGFPTLIDGTIFRNNERRMFLGGDTHQRPGLLQVGDYIYTGWASHCVQYNFTGAVIGFHRTTGKVVEAFATQGGPEPITVEGGGVWMSGGGLAYDGAGSMYFSTGNGYAGQLPENGRPVQGRNPPSALEEAVVNLRVGDDGSLKPVDFFMPWEKVQLDGADKDLGTTPFQLLPQDTFSCPNDRRIGMVTGKSGKTYWLNLDSLGGYQMGPDRLDDAIQVTQNENSVFAGAGVLPLGGGYVYVTVTGYQTKVFKFSCNSAGRGVFTHVSATPENNAGILGTGHGTVTTLDGREGSGLLWTTDREGQNLRIYEAMPPAEGGNLKLIKAFNFPDVTKFAKMSFGDGIAYIPTTNGVLHAYGSPVTLPLNCSSPYDFPRTPIGNTSTALRISCKANIQTSLSQLSISGNPNFRIDGLPTTPLSLNAGDAFSFNAYFSPKTVGLLSSDVLANTSNAVAGFSTSTPITLRGNATSATPLLAISPGTVSFTSMVGSGPSSNSAFFRNNGDSLLTFKNVSYSIKSESGPWISPNVTRDGKAQIGPFTFSNVPTTIAANGQVVVGITYNAMQAGNHAVYVKAFSDGGDKILDVFGTAGSAPVAVVEFQSPTNSTWLPYTPGQNFSFGEVLQGTTRNLVLRITNNGSDTASPLGLTISKPPFGVPGIVGAANNIDLAEGTNIPAGQSRNATLFCAVPESQVNVPNFKGSAKWTFNTNTDGGKFELHFDCTAVSQQLGPKLANGTSQFGYVGCFRDLTPNRQLATMTYGGAQNTNGQCMELCAAGDWKFAGTSYREECWCGNALPLTMDGNDDCNFRCSGAENQTCGGDGVLHDKSMLSLFADKQKFDGNTTTTPLTIPQRSGEYTYAGCYRETTGKTFNQKMTNSKTLTVDSCRKFCEGSTLFGVQWSEECFCGSTIATSASLTNDTDCNMSCKGDNSQYCGAGSRMQVYQLGGTLSSTSTTSTTPTCTPTTIPNAPAPTAIKCPESNGTTIASFGQNFVIECGIDHTGGDLASTQVNSFAECVDTCSRNAKCVDVSLSGVACYLKSALGPSVQNAGVLGARLLPPAQDCPGSRTTTTSRSSSSTSSRTATSTLSSSTSTLRSSTGTLSSATSSLSSSTSGTLSSSTGAPSSTTLRSTTLSTTTSSLPTATAVACPENNSTMYISNGRAFLVECGIDYMGGDMGSVGANNLTACIDACATRPGCINIALSGAACYMKNKINQPVYNGVAGARFISTQSSSTTSTTSTSRISSSTTTSLSMTTTTRLVTATSRSATSSLTTSRSTSPSTTPPRPSPTNSLSETTTTRLVTTTARSTTSSLTSRPSTSSSTTTARPSSTSSMPPAAPSTIGDYKYMGCYTEVGGRALKQGTTTNANMTNELCQKTCQGYQYFATEYANECFCGRTLHTDSRPATDNRCNMKCAGDNSQICGGPDGLTLYTLLNSDSSSPSSPIVVPSSNGYIAQGCFSEKSQGRALPEMFLTSNMTIPACAAEAKRQNSTWFGLEYADECFHGKTFDSTTSPPLNQTKCDMTCPGNSTTWCGGAAALQMYRLPLECPTDNSTMWNAYNGTAKFEIQCGMDRAGGSAGRWEARTFEDCLNACAMETTCKSVAYRGNDCYWKNSLGTIGSDAGVRGATVVERRERLSKR